MAKLTMVLLAVLYLTSNLYAGGFVLHSKRLPASSEIDSIEIFIDAGGNTFVVVRANRGAFYYLNDNLIDLEQYEDIWDVFLKDGHFHFYVQKNGNIHIYELTKDSGIKVVTSVDIKEALAGFSVPGTKMNVIPVPGQKDPYYLLASRWVFPVNPVEFLFDCASGGHGIYYVKPFLTEVRDGKLGKPQKLRYGGKIDETYYIKQVVQSGDFAHFFGLQAARTTCMGFAGNKIQMHACHIASRRLRFEEEKSNPDQSYIHRYSQR